MENYSTRSSPERIIESLLAELAEDRLTQNSDDPIDAAAAEFVRSPGPVRSQGAFLGEVTRLVRHIYASGLRVPQRLSSTQARARAIEGKPSVVTARTAVCRNSSGVQPASRALRMAE